MFKLYDEVYNNNKNNGVWTIVAFSEDTLCDNNLPMVKIVSNGMITWSKQSELKLI